MNAVRPALDATLAWVRESAGADDIPVAVSHFSDTLSAYELVKPLDPDLLARGREKVAALQAEQALERALHDAAKAMSDRRYADVVELLGPYEAELTGASANMREIARERAAP